MKMRQFLLILSSCLYLSLGVVDCKARELKHVAWSTSGTCTASYVPGGKVTIQKSTAPTATLQTTAVQNFFTHSDFGITLGTADTAGQVLSYVGELSKKFVNTAKHLAPAIGIIGSVLGTITGDKTPTADDILKTTNKAFEKMTEELDSRIEEMKDYVDTEIIRLLKDINHQKYKFLYSYWTGCIEGPANETELCQREANRLIQASVNEFAMYSDQFDRNTLKFNPLLTGDQIKRVEVNLILFRNYVFLSVMAMKTITSTYKDQQEKAYVDLYENQLQKNVKFYNDYAKASVDLVKQINLNYTSNYFSSKYEQEMRDHEKKVPDGTLLPEPDYLITTFVETEIKCKLQMNSRFTDYCKADVSVMLCKKGSKLYVNCKKGDRIPDNWRYKKSYSHYPVWSKYDVSHTPAFLARAICRSELNTKLKDFKSSYALSIKRYWENEVGKLLSCAKKLIDSKNLDNARETGGWKC